MGARTIRLRDPSVQRRITGRERLTLSKIMAALLIPMLLALALIAMDMRTDLASLKSAGKNDGSGALPVGWSDLEAPHQPAANLERIQQPGRQRVRMLGYMMDGYRPSHDGERVNIFILLPDAGHFLHPAHRNRDQMVEVRPAHPVAFRYRQLVWASGILNQTSPRQGDDKAAWAISDADVTQASDRDIGKWFHP